MKHTATATIQGVRLLPWLASAAAVISTGFWAPIDAVYIWFWIFICPTGNGFVVTIAGATSKALEHATSYVRIHKELQVILNHAFSKAAFARGTGVALNKDSRSTTRCTKSENQDKECQKIDPIISFHFSILVLLSL